MKHILQNSGYHYLLRPLIDTNNKQKLFNLFLDKNKNKSIDSWDKHDVYFENPLINVPYLHIKRYKKDRYTLSIFSSINAENINIKNRDDDKDKSWCILKKKISPDELEIYLKQNFLDDYKNRWLTRIDPSTEYDEKDLSNNFTEYWFKCKVTNSFLPESID